MEQPFSTLFPNGHIGHVFPDLNICQLYIRDFPSVSSLLSDHKPRLHIDGLNLLHFSLSSPDPWADL